jgi:Kef-type K+ transport system membrane component KefB
VVEDKLNHPLMILLVGCLIVLAILVRNGFSRAGLPPLLGFMILGFLLNLADVHYAFLSPWSREILELLAELGIITLLFHVGLKSNIIKLLRQLRRASYIWASGIGLSAALGYALAYYLLGLALLPSLFIAIALTATSVGVSVGIWQEAEALDSPTGELLIDVAEMDDISAIIFMALLFALAPVLQSGAPAALWSLVAKAGGLLMVKLLIFGAFCAFFSLYLERHVTLWFERITHPPVSLLVVAGLGIIMAAFAGLIGFSSAIGAFFAGLVFSRDPESPQIGEAFRPVYELLSPFFFIGIGLNVNPNLLVSALGLGLILLLGAFLGKFVGHGAPTWFTLGGSGAVLLGLSMVPRAEIAMIIMEQGLKLGPWAVPPEVYAAMVMVSAATCALPPLVVRPLLRRWPQCPEECPT